MKIKYNSAVSADILVGDKVVKTFGHGGKTFIEAKKGSKFTIRLRNHGSNRVLAVVSVDGINIISGKVAVEGDTEGYVLSGQQTYHVNGWRTDLNTVNLFEFDSKEKSYAAKNPEGDKSTENCGIVSVRFYEEKELKSYYIKSSDWPWDYYEKHPWVKPVDPLDPYPAPPHYPKVTWTSHLSDFGQSSVVRCCNLSQVQHNSVEEFSAGTKFSKEERQDVVNEVEFQTGSFIEQIDIYYDFIGGLEKMGVPVKPAPAISYPKGFKKFCQPPK
jgi:hypothetical protein